MVEENFEVEINMPLKNRQKIQDQYNKTLEQFKTFLQANFGTSNVQAATAIAAAIITAEIIINIATLGIGSGQLLKAQPSSVLNIYGAGLPIEQLPLSEQKTLAEWLPKLWTEEELEKLWQRIQYVQPSKTPEQFEQLRELLGGAR